MECRQDLYTDLYTATAWASLLGIACSYPYLIINFQMRILILNFIHLYDDHHADCCYKKDNIHTEGMEQAQYL